MKEFKVNDYITLKLEDGRTNIYVAGKLSKQCKFLLLSIPVKEISTFDEIESVDEAAERLDCKMEGSKAIGFNIPPKVEFWAHCSNMQVWAENNYDTRLIHSNLAFPLLKQLTKVDDPIAKAVFKEEIVKKLNSGYVNTILFLFEENYLEYLKKEELNNLDWNKIFEGFTQFCQRFDKIQFDSGYPIGDYIEKIRDFLRFLAKNIHSNLYFFKKFNEMNKNLQYLLISTLLITPEEIFPINLISSISIIKQRELDQLFQKVLYIYKNAYYIDIDLNTEILETLGKKGVDLIFLLIQQDIDIDYEYSLKENVAKNLTLFSNKFGRYINLKIRTFFSKISIKTIEEGIRKEYKNKGILNHLDIMETVSDAYNAYVQHFLSNIPKIDALEILLDEKLKIVENILGTYNNYKDLYSIQRLIPINLLEFVLRWIPKKEADVLNKLEQISDKKFNLLNGHEIIESPCIFVDDSRHVVKLGLGAVPLSQIPPEIANLKHLKRLVLTYTHINNVPEQIGELKELKELYLTANNITELPESICSLLKLEHLSVADNPLTKLPENIGNLKCLKHIDFYGTKIETLPESFFELYLDDYLYLPEHLCGYSLDKLQNVTKDVRPHRGPNVWI